MSFVLVVSATFQSPAGGSGLNTVLVVNQSIVESSRLANHYAELRQIPSDNVVKIQWGGGNTVWTEMEFQTNLLIPLLAAINQRGLINQIDTVVLSIGIPFQTAQQGTNINSTTSALYYGVKVDGGGDITATNSFAFSETSFRENRPASAKTNSFLVSMLTSDSLQQAMQLAERGVSSDESFPQPPAILAKTSDSSRNIRFANFDNAIFNVDVLARSALIRTNSDSPQGITNLFGFQTGLANYSISSNAFLPGAIADSLTSFGGKIFGANDQTTLLSFINAGAAGSYGTVSEPLADLQKFPDPMVYFFQARGFNIAESYYQSVSTPYQGLIVAEPLAAPFARTGAGHWGAGTSNAVLAGMVTLTNRFTASDATRPLHRVDLFVDGKFFNTLTNLAPGVGNQINLSLNGYPLTYHVGENETISSIAIGIASMVNEPANQNVTKIKALSRGDRVELQSIATNHQTFPFFVTGSTQSNSTNAAWRVNYLPETYPPRLTTGGKNKSGNFSMTIEIPTPLNYVVQASTNLFDWVNIATNATPGLFDFSDESSSGLPQRYYRVAGPTPYLPPKITLPVITNGGAFSMRVESLSGQACTVLYSSNQINWLPMFTNALGGVFDFVDNSAVVAGKRFYRAWITPPVSPAFTALTNSNNVLVRVDSAVQPYTVDVWTNGSSWTSVATNFSFRNIQLSASTTAGAATSSTTFVRAARPTFLASDAYGSQKCFVTKFPPTLAAGDYLRLVFTKTNGQSVAVAVTNQNSGMNYTNLVTQFVDAVNSNPDLQGEDGVVAEDLVFSFAGVFNLRARSKGFKAAGLRFISYRKGLSFNFTPTASELRGNLSDLQPRNHLYVTSGSTEINTSFVLDTTQLADGYHEFTAVAYEGSSVQTQTRTSIPVRIQNTELSATLTLIGLTNNSPASGTYEIQVSANTNDIASIRLFTTGGQIGVQTNISSADFIVFGTNLHAGLHPFYSIIETSSGKKYRTRTEWVRLAP